MVAHGTSINFETLFDYAESQLLAHTTTNSDLLGELSLYVIHSGGKRLRQKLSLLCGSIINAPTEYLIYVANATELLHTSTLLHDDVIDLATTRRNKPTVNAAWSNNHGILTGDFLFAKGFELITKIPIQELSTKLAQVTAGLVEGEILQLQAKEQRSISLKTYEQIIKAKTGNLLAFACESSTSFISDKSLKHLLQPAFSQLGHSIGRAFQIHDDLQDYLKEQSASGKEQFKDYRQGIFTFPLIVAMEKGNDKQKSQLMKFFGVNNSSIKSITSGNLLQVLHETGSIELALSSIDEDLEKCQEAIRTIQNHTNSPATQKLQGLLSNSFDLLYRAEKQA